jgi:hypothetical protein
MGEALAKKDNKDLIEDMQYFVFKVTTAGKKKINITIYSQPFSQKSCTHRTTLPSLFPHLLILRKKDISKIVKIFTQ